MNIAGGGGTVAFDIKSQNSENNYSRAIYAKDGGNINIGTSGETYATFNLDGAHVQGINVDGGNVNICTANNAASTATFNLGQNASITCSGVWGVFFGCVCGVRSAVVIGSTSSTFTLEATGTAMSGIYARGGSISLLGEVDFTLDSRGSAEGAGIAGIYSEGGAVEIGAEGTQNTAAFSLSGGYLRGISVSGEASSATFNGATTVNMTDGINNSYGIAASQGTLTFNNSVNITAQGASDTAYGIYATGAGSVVDIGGETTILYNGAATYSDGIYNSGGNVAISSNTTIEFKNTQSNCNGIHSVSGDIDFGIASQSAANQNVVVTINLDSAYNSNGLYIENGTIDIGGLTYSSEINSQYTNSLSNTAIYAKAGTVNFATTGTAEGQGVNIVSDNLGIVSGANLNFESGNVDITTPNGTAIYVYGGNIEADSGVNVNVISKIVGASWNISGLKAPDSIYNGVFVNGGSLIASGTFNVNHTGVANDDVRVAGGDNANIDSGYEYRDFKIKSFAVRVEGVAGTEVQLNSGEIINTVGGGLYVSGGTVTLGNENSQLGDISITTNGTSYSSVEYTVAGHEGSNWHAPVPITGGHAVQVNGGSLTIYNGTYQSALGNGILVSNGTADIKDGSFTGADPVENVENNVVRKDVAGAAANYGFKMYGGMVTIEGDTFGGNGSGAFVMGTDSATAVANIYGGSFDVTGQAGFSVYQYANVTFGKEGDSNDKITVKGLAAGLVIETTPNGAAPTVTINAGTFESIRDSNGDGVWYGNGSAKLTIIGGTFKGSSRAGLCIDDATQNSHRIVISGGTFKGSQAGLWYGKSAAFDDGLLIMGGTFEGDYGVYLAQNPWSQDGPLWDRETYNNVAIVAGTFTGDEKAIGDASNNQVKVGDVLTMHIDYNGQRYYATGTKVDGSFINGNAGGGNGGAVNDIGTSVILTMQPKY